MRRGSPVVLACCGALFGLSYVLVRMVGEAFGPIGTTAIRTWIGGSLLLAVAYARGQAPAWRSVPRLLVLGLLSAALPFTLLSVATLRLDAGTSAVLNASAPMFALLIDSVARRRWPSPLRSAGLAMAATGVALVMGTRGMGVESGTGAAVGVGAGLLGAMIFAYGGFYAGRHFTGSPPLGIAAGQQLTAGALLLPVLAVRHTTTEPVSSRDIVLVVLLGLLGSALAYLLFYWLIDREGPVWTANVNLLVPGYGVVWGWLFLGEPVPPLSVLGMAVTVFGLVLVLSPGRSGRGAP